MIKVTVASWAPWTPPLEFPLTVVLIKVTLAVPLTSMSATPPPVKFPLMALSVMVSVPDWILKAAPNESLPLVRVSPEREMVPLLKLKTRLLALPSMDNVAAPGPLIVRFLLMDSVPLVRVMAPVTAKSMVSPGAASAMA